MKTYKAPDNSLHEIDPEFSYLLPAGCIEITEQEAEQIRSSIAPAQMVPYSVTMRQARIALKRHQLLGQVTAVINSMQGDAGEEAKIEWEFSSEVKRNQPLTLQLATQLGLTSAELDSLFIEAASL